MKSNLEIQEGHYYELIPADVENDQAWYVRIKEGSYTETVIRYGAVRFEEDSIRFNFEIISSPEADLDVDDLGLQQEVGNILESILEDAVENYSLLTKTVE